MDITVISLILTSVTALAAVIGPIISSVINVRSNERTKRFEQYSPQVYEAVKHFTDSYSQLVRAADYEEAVTSYQRETLYLQASEAHKVFVSASYELIAFMPNPDICSQTKELLNSLAGKHLVSDAHDELFQKLAASIAQELHSELFQKKHISRKAKRRSRK